MFINYVLQVGDGVSRGRGVGERGREWEGRVTEGEWEEREWEREEKKKRKYFYDHPIFNIIIYKYIIYYVCSVCGIYCVVCVKHMVFTHTLHVTIGGAVYSGHVTHRTFVNYSSVPLFDVHSVRALAVFYCRKATSLSCSLCDLYFADHPYQC